MLHGLALSILAATVTTYRVFVELSPAMETVCASNDRLAIGLSRRYEATTTTTSRVALVPVRRSGLSIRSCGRLIARCSSSNGASNGRIPLWEENSTEDFVSEVDDDPDRPSEGFSSVAEALEAIKAGEIVIVVDDEDRENEGDLIMAASKVTEEAVALMVNEGTGIVCVPMKGEALDRLKLPLMVPDRENEEALMTAFTVSVDAVGTSTGVSAEDRAKTILTLASSESKPGDFKRPGHVFPLRYREGGVLKRAGHTEAAVDLAIMAGLPPAGVICEVVNKEGDMARLPRLRVFAKKYGLPLISIADMVRYRRKREKLVERTARTRLPTKWGLFYAYSYKSKLDGIEHVAMVKGDIGNGLDVLVRVHSECLTGDVFGSERCDCGNQLALAMMQIEQEGRGVVVYLRGHEGRGIGLGHKLRAYNLQDQGRDTVEANIDLGLPVDSREYGIGAQILRDVGVRTMKLMTNNPAKYMGLKGHGLAVTGRIPVISTVTAENKRYLETKRRKMGHIYGTDLNGSFAGLVVGAVKAKQQQDSAGLVMGAVKTKQKLEEQGEEEEPLKEASS